MRILLLGLLGCKPDLGWEGTSVGNPGDVTPKAALGVDVTHRSGTLAVSSWELADCSGERHSAPLGIELDIVSSAQLEIPPGTWCSVQLQLGGLLLQGESTLSGNRYEMVLDVRQIVLSSSGFTVDSSHYLLELGEPGWISDSILSLGSGDVVIDAAHPLHASLVGIVESRSGLYTDDDQDEEVDEDERERPVAQNEEDDDTGEEDTGEGEDTGED